MTMRTDVQIKHSPTICPYCHDTITQEQFAEAIVCEQCLARHHPDCWHGQCASCQSTRWVGMPVSSPQQSEPGISTQSSVESQQQEPELELVSGFARNAYLWAGHINVLSMFLYFASFLVFAVTVADSLESPPEAATKFALVVLPFALFHALMLLFMMGSNAIDFMLRKKTDELSYVPLIVNIMGFFTGGLASIFYYYYWGRRPLYREPSKPRTRKSRPNQSQNNSRKRHNSSKPNLKVSAKLLGEANKISSNIEPEKA